MNIRAKIFGNPADEPVLVNEKRPRGAEADKLRSVVVPREERRRSNSRQQDRHRLLNEQVRLTYGGKPRKVELINVSGGGAMIGGRFSPKLWDRVELHLGENGTIECAVCWIREDRIGLEFAHETRLDCSADEQAQVLRQVVIRSFPDLQFEGPTAPPPELSAEELRRERRHPLIWSGVLHHRDAKIKVRVRNISPTGAMIESADPVLVGGQAILELGEDGFIPATVAWLIGDQVGLRFRGQFDMAQLARSRPAVAPAKWVRPDYLKGAAADDSPWSATWQRMDVRELRQELEGFLKR
jgi:hypothetical protein